MRQPNDEMASYGVNGLYNMIINNEKGKSKIFECDLIIGGSTKKNN
jgi:DNA-binding LacI/PurR family transcriptional regulator